MASAPQQALSFNDVFEESEAEEIKEAQTVHRIRANSSIMQLKKVLGKPAFWPCPLGSVPQERRRPYTLD